MSSTGYSVPCHVCGRYGQHICPGMSLPHRAPPRTPWAPTQREYFTFAALISPKVASGFGEAGVAINAVNMADAVIAELAKS